MHGYFGNGYHEKATYLIEVWDSDSRNQPEVRLNWYRILTYRISKLIAVD